MLGVWDKDSEFPIACEDNNKALLPLWPTVGEVKTLDSRNLQDEVFARPQINSIPRKGRRQICAIKRGEDTCFHHGAWVKEGL